jgi:hypothetical protein
MKKEQIMNRLSSTHIEDLYIKRILKRAVRRLRCKGIRLIIRQTKESLLNIDWL